MNLIRNIVGARLVMLRLFVSALLCALTSPFALAQAPFEFGGLSTDLAFSNAVEKVQLLGGKCQVSVSQSSIAGVMANCELLHCSVGTEVGVCQEKNQPVALAIGSQAVIRIGLEAQAESSALQRIVFLFDGSLDAVAASLVKQFGPPDVDGTANTEPSWSHSQRRSWRRGNYNMGLLNSPNLVILTTNPPQTESGAQ